MNVHMTEMALQPATPLDIDGVLMMMRDFYAGFGLRFDACRARRAAAELLSQPSLGRIWLIRSGGETLGYAAVTFGFSLELHGRTAVLDEFFVAAPRRGRGIGTAALGRLDDECRKLGAKAMLLEWDERDLRVRALYERAGFSVRRYRLMLKTLAIE